MRQSGYTFIFLSGPEATMNRRLSIVASVLVFLPSVVRAQTSSGPSPGNRIEPLKAVVVVGDDVGQEVEFAAKREGKPTIYVFLQADKFDRPVARFLKTLDEELSKERGEAAIVAVWLTDDVEKGKEYLPRVQQSINLSQTTVAVYPGDKNGPTGWSINPGAHLTAVVAHDSKVTASFGYRSLNETNVPEVLAKLKK
jgi:hypothetical protein